MLLGEFVNSLLFLDSLLDRLDLTISFDFRICLGLNLVEITNTLEVHTDELERVTHETDNQ